MSSAKKQDLQLDVASQDWHQVVIAVHDIKTKQGVMVSPHSMGGFQSVGLEYVSVKAGVEPVIYSKPGLYVAQARLVVEGSCDDDSDTEEPQYDGYIEVKNAAPLKVKDSALQRLIKKLQEELTDVTMEANHYRLEANGLRQAIYQFGLNQYPSHRHQVAGLVNRMMNHLEPVLPECATVDGYKQAAKAAIDEGDLARAGILLSRADALMREQSIPQPVTPDVH
ncbi:MAG: hypothetical protein OIF57_13950 [Marinobacterium sp.]|nr:hypothetical protein [Marinobacterium sp.]